MTLYLIRHGATAATENRLYCGSTDLPLSHAGAAALQKQRMSFPGARFITSGMKRTEETLRLLFGDVPFQPEPRLREMSFGAFEMRGYSALKNDPAYEAWITGDNEANVPPGGESGAQMRARALEALAEILAAERDAVVVTHGGVIAAIMAHLFPEDGKNRYQWQPEPGCGYVIRDGGYRRFPEQP